MFSHQSNIGVSLSELFTQCRFHYADDIRVTACCSDADLCKSGDLYVALMQSNNDGHFSAEKAVERGASAVLTERLLPVEIPQCLVPNSAIAFAELCQRLAGDPTSDLHVVGIAGYHGKTAMQKMVTSVLAAAGQRPAILGDLGRTNRSTADRSTKAPMSSSRYAGWLASIAAMGCSHAVTALTRQSVLDQVFAGVNLQTLLLSGMATATHRKSATPKTKTYVRRLLEQLKPDGLVVANVDCPIVCDMIQSIQNPVLTVAVDGAADLTARRLEQFPSEQTFLVEAGEQTSVVRTKIIGDTHLQCCLMAIAAGLGTGASLSTAVGAVERIEGIPGMLERVECGQPFSVFSDAATSSHQLRQALLTLREVTDGKLICVFGQGESPQHELRSLRGSIVERYADLGVITSDVASESEPLRVVHDVLDGYRKPAKAHVMPNRTRAIEWALGRAQPGDTVLLAGPHNRQVIRSDDDFPSDGDVARFCLFSQDSKSGLWPVLTQAKSDPSWN